MSVKVLVRSSIPLQWPSFGWARTALASPQWNEAFGLLLDLLRPASVIAFLLAAWRLSADLGWTNAFLFHDGLLYHWQVWMALGFGMVASWQYFTARGNK